MTLVYTRETIAGLRDEVMAVAPLQAKFADDPGFGINPNWKLYEQLELIHRLLLIAVREDGRFIGYLAGVVHPHPNASHIMMGTISTYYVEERMNKVLILRTLFSHAINQIRKMGGQRVAIDTAYKFSCGRMLEAMGFTAKKITFECTLLAEMKETSCA